MALHIDFDNGVAVPAKDDLAGRQDLIRTAEAAANAARLLEAHGLDIAPTPEDEQVAAALSTAYAKDPEATSAAATPTRISAMTPASLSLTSRILSEFGREIVTDAVQVRHMVMNKLVLETENPDPRIRIRALELLGKITDVGLFTDRSAVTITHQSTADLRESLRSKLTQLKNVTPEDAEIVDDGDDAGR